MPASQPSIRASCLCLVALLTACGDDATSDGGGGSSTSTSSGAAGGGGAGTSSSHSTSSQSTSTTGVGAMGGAGGEAPDWACVGEVSYPGPVGATAVVQGSAGDVLSAQAVAGVTIDVCDRADLGCATPLATTTSQDPQFPPLTIPTLPPIGFAGYFRTTGPNLVPSNHYFNPIAADAYGIYLAVATVDEANAAAAIAGVTLDPGRAQIIIAVTNCNQNPGLVYGTLASDMIVSVDAATAGTTTVYSGANNIPNPMLTATSGAGSAVIFNVPPGPTTVRSFIASSSLQTAEFDVALVAGEITHVVMAPTP
ncbi:MAG: hypothetical protein U0271_24835 [Polyangiaceae bacterium]